MVFIRIVMELGGSLSESTSRSEGKFSSLVFLSGQRVESFSALHGGKGTSGLHFKVLECFSNHFY